MIPSGHVAGDRLLCLVGERITRSIREVDTAVRLGGDEFAIILVDVSDRATIEMLADRLIVNVSKPYSIDDQPAVIGVSIGVAVSRPGVTTAAVVAEAHLAMYDAKDAGKGTFRIFEERLRTRIDQKMAARNDLRYALERNELEAHYQPLIDLAQNRVAAFEALVRHGSLVDTEIHRCSHSWPLYVRHTIESSAKIARAGVAQGPASRR